MIDEMLISNQMLKKLFYIWIMYQCNPNIAFQEPLHWWNANIVESNALIIMLLDFNYT